MIFFTFWVKRQSLFLLIYRSLSPKPRKFTDTRIPYAHRALEAIVNNTIGNGIIAQIRCADEGKRKDIVDIWKEWSESSAIDAEGRKSFYELQAQVLRTVASDGDALVRIIPNKNASAIPYQLQILEPDYLDSYKEFKTYNGFICSGIEFEKAGNIYQRKAYWLFKEHKAT